MRKKTTEIATPGMTQSLLDSGIVLYYLKELSGQSGSIQNFDPNTAYNDRYCVGTINRDRKEVQGHYLAVF